MLGGRGQGLEGHPGGRPARQKALASSGGQQQRPFPGGQPELGGDPGDRLRGLAEQDLGGGVRDHRAAQVGGQHVFGVLGDGGQPGPGLAGGLGQPVHKFRAFAVAHQQPRLIDGDQPPPPVRRVRDLPPGRVQGEQGRGRAQFVGDVAEAEDHQVPVGAGGGRRGEQPGVAALGERDEPVRQRGRGRRSGGAQRGGQGRQQRGGPRPGARVAGDPGPLVGGHDRLVQGGALGRGGLAAAQHRDDGVQEQGAPGEGVRPGPRRRGQVERVEVDAGGAQVDVRAAGGGGEPGVLVLGVDHPAFGALVQRPEDLQLGQVGLPGAGRGEGDGVVVVGRPPVPGHQPRPGGVGPVQHAGQRAGAGRVAGQVGGGERETGGERGGVHSAAQQQHVGAGRERGGPALQGPERGRDGDQQQRGGQRPDRGDLRGQFLLAAGVDGQVQAEAEQLALAAGQPVGQVAGVAGGGLGVGVIELAPVSGRSRARIPGGRAAAAAGQRRPAPGLARYAR